MTALYVLGILLLALILIGFLPVGVQGEYSAEGYWVAVKIGPAAIRILPRKPRPEGKPPKKREEKEKKKAEPGEEKPEAQPGMKRGGNLPMFKELLALVLDAQKSVRKKLKIRELTLYLTMGGGGEDPAKSAVLYGRAWAAIGNLWMGF